MHRNKGVYNCGRRLEPMKIRITPAYTAPYTLWRENVWFCLFFCFLFIFFFRSFNVKCTTMLPRVSSSYGALWMFICCKNICALVYFIAHVYCDAAYPLALASALVAVAGLLFCYTWKVFCEPKNINGITCSFFGSSTFFFFSFIFPHP